MIQRSEPVTQDRWRTLGCMTVEDADARLERPAAGARVAGRVALLHLPTRRVLLQLHGWPHEPHWACPGGGAEQAETPRQAAARELQEETGRTDPLLQELFTWEHDFRFAGELVHQIETYYPARTDDDTLPLTAPDPADGITRRAWLHLDEIRSLELPVWPPDLAERVDRLWS